MNKYSLCLIDNDIPAINANINDRKVITANDLSLICEKVKDWDDNSIEILVNRLLENDDLWNILAFTHPEFYLSWSESALTQPDIFIFDWDYHTDSGDMASIEYLKQVLENGFSLVFIFTGFDQDRHVRAIIDNRFIEYKNRVKLFDKADQESVDCLINHINEMKNTNFAFKFGNELKEKSIKAVDRILVELGKVQIEHAIKYFNVDKNGGNDLIDFISTRYRNYLTDFIFQKEFDGESQSQPDVDESELAEKLWSYRIYYLSNDCLVRRGDIIENTESKKKYLIISADCHLARFWNKNFGYLNLIPLHEIDKTLLPHLLDFRIFGKNKSGVKKAGLATKSLTDQISGFPIGPFLLPFLYSNQQYQNFVGFSKEILSINIAPPEGLSNKKLKEATLLYDHLSDYERICSMSEPFLTPLIDNIFKSIMGLGVPDYGDTVKGIIKDSNLESLQ